MIDKWLTIKVAARLGFFGQVCPISQHQPVTREVKSLADGITLTAEAAEEEETEADRESSVLGSRTLAAPAAVKPSFCQSADASGLAMDRRRTRTIVKQAKEQTTRNNAIRTMPAARVGTDI